MREPRQLGHEPATSRGFISNPKSAWLYIEETYGTRTTDMRDLTNMILRAKVQKRDQDMGIGQRLAPCDASNFRFGASIMYNINWAQRFTYLCTVDVRMDIMHVSYHRMFRNTSQAVDEFYVSYYHVLLFP
jgi:hypothetical protein